MVDLPAPLGPTIPTRSPAATSKERPSCAARRPPGYENVTPSKPTEGASDDASQSGISRSLTSGSASRICMMPPAAEMPSMPLWRTTRRSRSGRNTSMPSIRMTRSAVRLICPASTRQAPSASAAAAPTAMPVSVMPRANVFAPSTPIVLWKSAVPFSASRRPREPLWPKALSVASPWTESRNSAPKAA